jgi:hypothetical protein
LTFNLLLYFAACQWSISTFKVIKTGFFTH